MEVYPHSTVYSFLMSDLSMNVILLNVVARNYLIHDGSLFRISTNDMTKAAKVIL